MKDASGEYNASPLTNLLQTQSMTRDDMEGIDGLIQEAVETADKGEPPKSQHLKAKIARLTTIYSNQAVKKSALIRRLPADTVDSSKSGPNTRREDNMHLVKMPTMDYKPDTRSLAEQPSQGTASTRTLSLHKMKGVIPPALRLGKTFIQHQLLTPQHAFSPASIFLVGGKAPANRCSATRTEEELHNIKTNPKIRRFAESFSRSTAANSTLKQDSIKCLSGENKIKARSRKCKDKRLIDVIDKAKAVIDEYKRREEALIKQNGALKEKVTSLRKALSVYIKHK